MADHWAYDENCIIYAVSLPRCHGVAGLEATSVCHFEIRRTNHGLGFLRDEFTDDELKAPLSRVGLSSYEVAHHITDMYHHCAFRGTYTKTLQPSGSGEPARRAAVGLAPLVSAEEAAAAEEEEWVEVDECLVWSPTGKGCIHWASELDGNAQRRFEKVQMEGTRDPRRGGSGTTR